MKADSILAAEFKQQLKSNYFVSPEEEVKWLNKEDEDEMNNTIISCKSELSNCNSSINITSASNAKYNDCDSTNRQCTTKFSNWSPPIEITEEVFHAIPTYVDNKCVVYLHPKKYSTLP